MNPPKLTVVVLTYNRPHTLVRTLDSILAQSYDDFGVLVLDNCSTDETPKILEEYAARDSRVRCVRNERNIGIARNWNRGFTLNQSKYVSIFHDDDLMLPGFLEQTVHALELHPTAAFVIVQAQFIDENGNFSGVQDTGDVPDGLMRGIDLLELSVDGRGIGIFPPTIVMRASAVREAGALESPHTRGYLDIDFYNRMAARHDVVFIRRQLVQYRVHGGSDTELLNREAGSTPWYGELATKIDAIAHLLRAPRASGEAYRTWLADRLLYLHAHQSAAIHPAIPAMYHAWGTRLDMVREQIASLIPAGSTFILVDDGQLGFPGEWEGRKVLPLRERDGDYFGPPGSDEEAIAELTRLRSAGARWIVFAWPCFWWLDRYWKFRKHIVDRFPCRANVPNIVAYELSGA